MRAFSLQNSKGRVQIHIFALISKDIAHCYKKRTGSRFYCVIVEAKKFTEAILVRPVCCETLVRRSIDKTSMALIAARIF